MDLKKLFYPKRIAVVGATNKKGKIGNLIFSNLLKSDVEAFPVNPYEKEVLGVKSYSHVKEVKVDVAIFAIPEKVIYDAINASTFKYAVIITAGFSEIGNKEGEEKLLKIARKNKFRILGPNIIGFINNDYKLNASFIPEIPAKGNISLISQSGALAISLVGYSKMRKIGLNKVVSVGNAIDLGIEEILEYLTKDKSTEKIALYVEGVKDGNKFYNILKNSKKEVVILKAGRSLKSKEAIKSHTSSLAGDYKIYEGIIKQTNKRIALNLTNLFDKLITKKVSGEVYIITNGGGLGILTVDEIKDKIKLAKLKEKTKIKLKEILPKFASIKNPLDVSGSSTEKEYDKAINLLIKKEKAKNIIVLYCHTAITNPLKVAKVISKYKDKANLYSCFVGGNEVEKAIDYLNSKGIPSFNSPERLINAMM